jgi:U3 small nucleolar RNA-associated protein 10
MYSKGELLSETISDLIEPIIEQFKLSENKNKMLTYYDDAIKDCVCEMFKNIKSDDLFREFNEELLNLIKEENYITRYLALKMVLHLLEVIKERYLTLIGEIIPYIADTLEDSNELVQQQAVMNIKYIERVTGEKYTSYLE